MIGAQSELRLHREYTLANVVAKKRLRIVPCLLTPTILSYLPQIIVQDPAQHDHRPDNRNPSQHLPVKNRDKYRIQYRLQRIDDGSCHRVRMMEAVTGSVYFVPNVKKI